MKALILLSLIIIYPALTEAEINNLQNGKNNFNNKYAIDNLISCLTSENQGVKRQGVYFAGLYKVDESVDYLIDIIKNQNNDEVQKLAVLSLLRIDSPKGIKFLKKFTVESDNTDLQKLSSFVYLDDASMK
ncbi:MAG: HEAT repeat domain-containing protein [Ignavibacteria bacterium]|nr:HEAT repeat domain-containing protein [Ignavibacteria bacterium]